MNSESLSPSVIVGTPFAVSLAHLDLDLSQANRPSLVSSVLQGCLQTEDGQPVSWQRVHATDIARRLQWLLELCRVTGVQVMDLHCACPACAGKMALSLDPGSFEQPSVPGEFDCEPQAGVLLRLRLPTGEDQSRWAAVQIDDFSQLAADLVLAVEATGDTRSETGPDRKDGVTIQADWLPEIEAALEAADPLTALQIQTECPDCGHAFELPIDLEQLLLQRLMVEQTRVLRDIHRLASAYHWHEQEILALTPARRAFYLRCIGHGGER